MTSTISIKTTHFLLGQKVLSYGITSQQPDKAYNTKKWKKKDS